MSYIYRYSNVSRQFELAQELATSGAFGWEAFTHSGVVHLALANYFNGNSYNVMSQIYRHSTVSGQLFELVQEVQTSGAIDWEAFPLTGVTYLAVANSFNGSTHLIDSHIYRYSTASGLFEVVQEVATTGAYGWKAFAHNGVAHLAVANYYNDETRQIDSRIYRHATESGRFEVTQGVATLGAVDWEALSLNGVTYLAVANHNSDFGYNLLSRIYAFDVSCLQSKDWQ